MHGHSVSLIRGYCSSTERYLFLNLIEDTIHWSLIKQSLQPNILQRTIEVDEWSETVGSI